MNRYQTMSRRLLEPVPPTAPGSKPPFWLTQQPLLAPDWLARARQQAGQPAGRTNPR